MPLSYRAHFPAPLELGVAAGEMGTELLDHFQAVPLKGMDFCGLIFPFQELDPEMEAIY